MSGLPEPATEYNREYLVDIRDAMIALFDISAEEAEGRITSTLGNLDLMDVKTEEYLGHEEPEHWAKSVYYEQVLWWTLDESERNPKPWP